MTTLFDATRYPADEIAELYFKSWDVELFFRDIKTSMDMGILRCKSPAMIRKEIMMHLITYNCIQSLIVEASVHTQLKVRRIRFKASLQVVRLWGMQLTQDMSGKKQHDFICLLYQSIAQNIVDAGFPV